MQENWHTNQLVHKPSVQSSVAVICLLIYISSSSLTHPQNPIYQIKFFKALIQVQPKNYT